MRWLRRLVTLLVVALVIVAIGYGFVPSPPRVAVAAVARGPLQVTVREEGRTRVKDRYVISAPVPGFGQRVTLEVGDAGGFGVGAYAVRLDDLGDRGARDGTRGARGDLARALQRLVDGNQALLDRLRDSATFVLAARQLDEALAESRRQRADKLVDEYAFKAVVGALAAITPGADLVIQGWLGTQLIRELAAVYDTRVGKVDSDLLLRLVQQHVGRAHTLLLAVSGNALKAFPGIGTLAGGALHAIAYGIIFRTLGRALSLTLATRGELHPMQTARLFEERLGGDLETSARDLARVVATRIRKKDGS